MTDEAAAGPPSEATPSGASATQRRPPEAPLNTAVVPAAVILDSDLQLIYCLGDVSPFVGLPDGAPEWQVFRLLSNGLHDPVRRVVLQARDTGVGHRARAAVATEGGYRPAEVSAIPLGRGRAGPLLLSFAWQEPGGSLRSGSGSDEARGAVPLSDGDGRAVVDRLPVRIPGSDVGIGPGPAAWQLQVANEELQAANEELRVQIEEDQRQKILIAELRHRIKNLLTTVQAVALQSLRQSNSLDAFRESFLARLRALGACHDLLVQTGWRSAPLGELIMATLEPYLRPGLDRVAIDCAELALPPAAAQALTLALHELATNAAKHGALSVEPGRLELAAEAARANGGEHIRIGWVEIGGPPAVVPEEKGFGLRLIEGSVRTELNGEIHLDFRADGLRVAIAFPVPPGS